MCGQVANSKLLAKDDCEPRRFFGDSDLVCTSRPKYSTGSLKPHFMSQFYVCR
jgi:hypothetical protein